MNTAHDSVISPTATATPGAATARYQIYQQALSGNYVPGLTMDSATDAIRVFVSQSPAFEGGELRLWDHREKRLSASVKWNLQRTESGALAQVRENVFPDRIMAMLARLIQPQEKLREVIQRGVQLRA